MTRKLTAKMALAMIDQGVDNSGDWLELWPAWREHGLHRAKLLLADIRALGFDVVPRKTTKVRRVKRGKR